MTTSAKTSILYTYAKNQTSDEKIYNLHDVRFRIDPGKKNHGKINKISKYDGYRNLKDVLQFKVLSQDDQLQYDQKDTEKDGKISKCKWKIKT